MSSRTSVWSLVVAALAVTLAGCGSGGGSGKAGTPDSGAPDGGAGSNGADAGGADAGGGGDDGGGAQVLPPYVGRIVITPAALLFTDAGQSAPLHAQAFDATGAPMNAALTFTSSRPAQVAVDASSGNVTSMTALGSTQITVTGAGLTSRPLLVLVVQPQPGTVLVSDAQVVSGPTQVDPTADPVPGAQVQVTLDGVGALAPGTMLLSREGNPVAGQVVSTTPNGAHTDVVYQLPTLLDLFARLDFQAGYDYTLQTAADDDAIAAMAAAAGAPPGTSARSSALDFDIGAFKCKSSVDPTGITISQSLTVVPNLHFDAAFSKDEDGDWTDARMVMTGNIKTTGKVTAKLAPGAVASLSCKYQWKEFIPPVAGPLSAVVAPRIPVGVKASIKGAATFGALELGGKLEESADFAFGFSAGLHGTGDVATFNLGDPHLEPMYSLNKDILPLGIEISASLGAYASLNWSFLEIGLADAFVGAKLKYQLMTVPNQVGSSTANKYQLKAPVLEVGPGSAINKALSFLGGAVSFSTSITEEGPVVAGSPSGTFTADNTKLDVPANKPITFTVKLDPASTSFLGISNVSGVHIYRVDMPLIMDPLNEVKYFNGPGPTYTWTWTPKLSDEGQYLFVAATDDELIYSLDAIGVTSPFWMAPAIQINVGPPAGNWGGTSTVTWTGSGPSSANGTITEQGSQTVTWVPGMPSPDGMSFDMVPTTAMFNITITMTESETLGVCPATRTFVATANLTLDAEDADTEAHGHLVLIRDGNSLDYTSGVPGLYGLADVNDDIVSDCGTSTHNTTTLNVGADGAPVMGTIPSDATTITGGTTYTGSGFEGVPRTYSATWSFQKM